MHECNAMAAGPTESWLDPGNEAALFIFVPYVISKSEESISYWLRCCRKGGSQASPYVSLFSRRQQRWNRRWKVLFADPEQRSSNYSPPFTSQILVALKQLLEPAETTSAAFPFGGPCDTLEAKNSRPASSSSFRFGRPHPQLAIMNSLATPPVPPHFHEHTRLSPSRSSM
jgi:hypothetical protein